MTNPAPDHHTDILMEYRYEKPSGEFVSRVVNNYTTLINIGIGCKF